MDNLWILTEERPKRATIKKIIELYCTDYNDEVVTQAEVKIRPIINNGVFKFVYQVEGYRLVNVNNIFIKIVSGSSSFVDFLVFKQENAPKEQGEEKSPIMAIEETKTNGAESRNTSVYQRGIKFVYISKYYKSTKLYMLYNSINMQQKKGPTKTEIFGTRLLLTIGVKIIGKNIDSWGGPFASIDELIRYKAEMKSAHTNNVPITIIKAGKRIEISGRLSKPASAGNIGHDPNIGALSTIAACLRQLGWNKEIVITKHNVKQEYINQTRGKNKFLYVCNILNVQLNNIKLPMFNKLPEMYWHYEVSSEKVASILLHVQAEYHGMKCVYENHAGCERGYFYTKSGAAITLPKYNKEGKKVFLPDIILYDDKTNVTLLVEGKKHSTLSLGIRELDNYDIIENEYICPEYKDTTVVRCLSIFGDEDKTPLNEKVLLYLTNTGQIVINANAIESVKRCFQDT